MVDDDMDMNALPKTNYIKSIVTAEAKMDLERKGIQSYQQQLYARFLCFGNGALADGKTVVVRQQPMQSLQTP